MSQFTCINELLLLLLDLGHHGPPDPLGQRRLPPSGLARDGRLEVGVTTWKYVSDIFNDRVIYFSVTYRSFS